MPHLKLTPVLFTVTIFLSASLLFFVQPLFTKIVLPLVGGAPAVWTTAMLFFQTVLIAGYLYAHLSTKYLPIAAQVGLHMALWVAALFFLPLSVEAGWRLEPNIPVAQQTLALFAVGVGLPFAVLSANAPLIQSWYARSDGPSADDPYFLYGASNLGSLIALLAFPLAAEPFFGATQIGSSWAVGFVLLGIFLAFSGFAARREKTTSQNTDAITKPLLSSYLWWLFLAFIPSSLMLAVTTKISTDLGSFPLVWVLPLSLFLLTFVLSFTNNFWMSDATLNWLFIISLGVIAIIAAGADKVSTAIYVSSLLLFGFFFVALRIHRALYEARPAKENLTAFYLTMSIGGALGGLFNSILAPVLFVQLDELAVTTLLGAALLLSYARWPNIRNLAYGLLACAAVVSPFLFSATFGGLLTYVLFATILLGALFLFRKQAAMTFLVLSTVLVFGRLLSVEENVFQDRSFFGLHLVVDRDELRKYQNGTTIHGAQLLSDFEQDSRPTPIAYYHPDAPMAQIMTSEFGKAAENIGIVGLGIGSLACYATPGQSWQFYEIDAMVDQIARDPRYFTFMSKCAPLAPTHIGDARLVLEAQSDIRYDILLIDAYSSDAVPVHLITNEAIELYRSRLTDDGVLVLHISNRYYDLSLPLARSANDLGLVSHIQRYKGEPQSADNSASRVVIMANADSDLVDLYTTGPWQPLVSDGKRLWTDDYANLLSILAR
ncbi:fused MFS/spermidine synthase [Roseobacter sp. CCS2]|uniref:fused MFS/spermidine synthase n=1 Tax=Roseobacter sp. CCS2 TaxID=391593 RepID=UPI0000F3C6A7|nr:fused MFS/spermidine synthase [Roseobacter sp. CCS2]EBA11641.1 hypothetical protein RCCS2_16971 [Roseobacter sp. CCS2]